MKAAFGYKFQWDKDLCFDQYLRIFNMFHYIYKFNLYLKLLTPNRSLHFNFFPLKFHQKFEILSFILINPSNKKKSLNQGQKIETFSEKSIKRACERELTTLKLLSNFPSPSSFKTELFRTLFWISSKQMF